MARAPARPMGTRGLRAGRRHARLATGGAGREGCVAGPVRLVGDRPVLVALRLVEADAETIVRAVLVGDAGGRLRAILVAGAGLDTAVPTLELRQALLVGPLVALV